MSGREQKKLKQETRACIAYIVGRLIFGSEASSIYDYSQSKQISFSGHVTSAGVDVTMEFPESSDGWRVTSENSSNRGNSLYLYLYNHPTMKHIELFVHNNGHFSGYDLDPQRSFEGFANGNNIFLKDFDFPDQYTYSI
ncbi:MAG: hypothetical protein M3384_00985 [Acidobacteriota bacterium]|nr:hypothetical protein [Acidobacteriota bacterium]